MNVFLSYSSTDAALARKLALDLRSVHIDVWLDQWQLGVGEDIVQRIEQGINNADFVIVLLTPASVLSDWVDREWRQKIHDEAQSERISIIPVRGEPCDMPDFLAQRSYSDISGGSYPMGFQHLLEILRHYGGDTLPDLPQSPASVSESSSLMIPVVAPITLEVGHELIPLFKPDVMGRNRFFDVLAPQMHTTLHRELGFHFPGIRVRGNDRDMPARSALIMIDEIPELMIAVGPDNALAIASVEQLAAMGISGHPGQHPRSDCLCSWISGLADSVSVQNAGIPILDAAEYITLMLESLIRRMAASFLDLDMTRQLVEEVAVIAPELVEKVVPKQLPWIVLTDILRRLLDEEIGVENMTAILTALAESPPEQRDAVVLAERARQALSSQITAKFTQGQGKLLVFRLSPVIEDRMACAIQYIAGGQYLHLEPQFMQGILAAIRNQVNASAPLGLKTPILTIWPIRRYVRKLVELEFPRLQVLAHEDLMPSVELQILDWIELRSTTVHGGVAR